MKSTTEIYERFQKVNRFSDLPSEMYELGVAHGVIHEIALLSGTLDSCRNRLARAERLGVIRNSERSMIQRDLDKIVRAVAELVDISKARIDPKPNLQANVVQLEAAQ